MSELPRLMLISDVPVCFGASHGSEALVRLFQHYPSDHLIVVQTQGPMPEPERRLPDQAYHVWQLPWDRLLRTRLNVIGTIMQAIHHRYLFWRFVTAVKAAAPAAIVTLVHANGWVLARRIAAQLSLPLHLIVHDGPDHFQCNSLIVGKMMRQEFQLACRQAASRFSICAALDRHIEQIIGIKGQIMPPLQCRDDKTPERVAAKDTGSQAVYFGSLNSVSITAMINDFAHELARFGGALHAWGGLSPNIKASVPWKDRVFQHHGAFADRNQILAYCRRSCHYMYLPFSFVDENTSFSFPSKLVDYTLVGLPIIVQAPPSSPIGVWCADHPEAALFIGEPGREALGRAISTLLSSEDLRMRFAHGALKAGQESFSFKPHWQRFIKAIRSNTHTTQATTPCYRS